MSNRNFIFDGNRIISPLGVILVTFGLVFCVAVPPLGLLLIAAALASQGRFLGRHRRARQAGRAVVAEQARRTRILALKSL